MLNLIFCTRISTDSSTLFAKWRLREIVYSSTWKITDVHVNLLIVYADLRRRLRHIYIIVYVILFWLSTFVFFIAYVILPYEVYSTKRTLRKYTLRKTLYETTH